jgi:hypothetical protein
LDIQLNGYKILFATLLALGITSCALLLLNLTPAGFLLTIPAWPFAIIFAALTRSDSPFVIPVTTFLAYLCLILAIVFLGANSSPVSKWRFWTAVLAIAVPVLTFLACIPRLDPLFPQGMTALRRKESAFAGRVHDGATLAQVSEILRSASVDFKEEVEESAVVLLSREEVSIHAAAGDRVLFTHFSPSDVKTNADAYQFPCRYDLQLIFVFGQDDKVRQRYTGHSRLCP